MPSKCRTITRRHDTISGRDGLSPESRSAMRAFAGRARRSFRRRLDARSERLLVSFCNLGVPEKPKLALVKFKTGENEGEKRWIWFKEGIHLRGPRDCASGRTDSSVSPINAAQTIHVGSSSSTLPETLRSRLGGRHRQAFAWHPLGMLRRQGSLFRALGERLHLPGDFHPAQEDMGDSAILDASRHHRRGR